MRKPHLGISLWFKSVGRQNEPVSLSLYNWGNRLQHAWKIKIRSWVMHKCLPTMKQLAKQPNNSSDNGIQINPWVICSSGLCSHCDVNKYPAQLSGSAAAILCGTGNFHETWKQRSPLLPECLSVSVGVVPLWQPWRRRWIDLDRSLIRYVWILAAADASSAVQWRFEPKSSLTLCCSRKRWMREAQADEVSEYNCDALANYRQPQWPGGSKMPGQII